MHTGPCAVCLQCVQHAHYVAHIRKWVYFCATSDCLLIVLCFEGVVEAVEPIACSCYPAGV